jgi:hypothetical protein
MGGTYKTAETHWKNESWVPAKGIEDRSNKIIPKNSQILGKRYSSR